MSDNYGLSPNGASEPASRKPGKRARRHREAPEMGQMVARLGRAMVRRAEAGDLEALIALQAMRDDVDQAIGDAARALNMDGNPAGYSWAVIGEATGTTRQNARQRWSQAGKKPTGPDPDRETTLPGL